ncbi:hypothetical protein T484DRAFT_1821012 [Baffinella frigidus]|nr:hypothetical protein T484DRAFT_1821012 [Cryptophyta sp. CCMP2293]
MDSTTKMVLEFALQTRNKALLEASNATNATWNAVLESTRLEAQLEETEEHLADRDGEIQSLQEDAADRIDEIQSLQRACKAKNMMGKQIKRLHREGAEQSRGWWETVTARDAEIEHLRGALTARDAQIQRLLHDNDCLSAGYQHGMGQTAEAALAAKDDAMTRFGREIERLRRAGKDKDEELAHLRQLGDEKDEKMASICRAGAQVGEKFLSDAKQRQVTEERARAELAGKDAELLRARQECTEQVRTRVGSNPGTCLI